MDTPDPCYTPSLTDTLACTATQKSTDNADSTGNPHLTDISSSRGASVSTEASGPIDIPSPPDGPYVDSEIHLVYYKNQYNASYKTDERVLRQIIRNNVRCYRPSDKLKLVVYYKSSSISSLITKNDQSPPISDLQKTNLVYEFVCNKGWCEHLKCSNVGVTETT